jgi:hypothetical protein
MKTGSLKSEFTTPYDKRESRHMRKWYGDMPEDGKCWTKELETVDGNAALEDKWKAIEFEMTYDADQDPAGPANAILDTKVKKGLAAEFCVVEVQQPTTYHLGIDKDMSGAQHSYQIFGSWSHFKAPQEMTPSHDGSWSIEISLGVNGWEQFFLIQDGNFERQIYPAFERSYKDMPCVGPHKGPGKAQFWMINGSPADDMPQEDAGEPGDKYLITFKWDTVKKLTWEKVGTGSGSVEDDGSYFILGSWSCFDPLPMAKADGAFTFEAQLTRMKLEFQIQRGHDSSGPDGMQTVYPDIDAGFGNAQSRVAPIGEFGAGKYWSIDGKEGDVFLITLYRDPVDCSDISVTWKKTGTRPVADVRDRYFLSGIWNGFTSQGTEMSYDEGMKCYTAEVPIYIIPTSFNVVVNKNGGKRIHPDKKDCSQIQQHEVKGPDSEGDGFHWLIGKSQADKARQGDTFIVKLELETKRAVTWKKKD